jgi:thioredoxin reductase (NADPH)
MEDAVIVGGGIAGLQAAIQLGRGQHRILVVDSGKGRSTLCRGYHNVLGWPHGVSGDELRKLGREHAEQYGVLFVQDEVVSAEKQGDGFRLTGKSGGVYEGTLLLVATGVMDRYPPLPRLEECMGITVFVCPDCDSYEIRGKRTVVMGSGETGARMALQLQDIAESMVYVNHEMKPVNAETSRKLSEAGVTLHGSPIREVLVEGDGSLRGVKLENGAQVEAVRGFIAFGGNEVRTDLLKQLGAERVENGHAMADPRTRKTSVAGVWTAGDIGLHSEQLVIAMGDGMQAAIWMHKELVERRNKSQSMNQS